MTYSNFATVAIENYWQEKYTVCKQRAAAESGFVVGTFGDSITDICPWPTINGEQYANCGLGAAGSSDVAATFGAPAFNVLGLSGVLLMVGVNDTAYNINGRQVLQFESGYTTFIKAVQLAKIPMSLFTILPLAAGSQQANNYASRNPIIRIFNRIISGYSTTYNVPLYDTYSLIVGPDGNALPGMLQPDMGLHPNATGYAAIKPLYDQAAAIIGGTNGTTI